VDHPPDDIWNPQMLRGDPRLTDRLVRHAKTPIGQNQGGGYGPTVQLADWMLVTSYSWRHAKKKRHLELVRWHAP